MGSAVTAALLRGATLVLPSAAPDGMATLAALSSVSPPAPLPTQTTTTSLMPLS